MSAPELGDLNLQVLPSFEALAANESIESFMRCALEHLIGLARQEDKQPLRPENIFKMLVHIRDIRDKAPADQSYIKPSDCKESTSLPKTFSNAVNQLDIPSCVFALPDRKLPRNLDDYRLVPLTAKRYQHSYHTGGFSYTLPKGVEVDDDGSAERLYLDTSLAIGLAYKGTIRAVAGGYINSPLDQIDLVQIQGVAGRFTGAQDRFKSGLYGGFNWRGTLVKAWASLAPVLGPDNISVDSATNHYWAGNDNYLQLLRGYDCLAEQMNFEINPRTGDWIKPARELV